MRTVPGQTPGRLGVPGTWHVPDRRFTSFLCSAFRPVCLHSEASRRGARFVVNSLTDPWRTLGVSRTADEKEVKRAHRKLVLQHHPDIRKEDAEAEVRFLAIQEAYEIIMGRRRGKELDASPNGNGWDFHDWYWRFSMSKRWGRSKSSARAGTANPFASATPPPNRQWKSQLEGLKQKAAAKNAKQRSCSSSSSAEGFESNEQGRTKPAWSAMKKKQPFANQDQPGQQHAEQLHSGPSMQGWAGAKVASANSTQDMSRQQPRTEASAPADIRTSLNNSVIAPGLGGDGGHASEKVMPAGGTAGPAAAGSGGDAGYTVVPLQHAHQDESSSHSQQPPSPGPRPGLKVDWSFLQHTEEQLVYAVNEFSQGGEDHTSTGGHHGAGREGHHDDLAQHAEHAQVHGFLQHVAGHVQRLRQHSEGRVHSHAVRFARHASQLGQHLQVRLRSLSASHGTEAPAPHHAGNSHHADLHLEFEETVRMRHPWSGVGAHRRGPDFRGVDTAAVKEQHASRRRRGSPGGAAVAEPSPLVSSDAASLEGSDHPDVGGVGFNVGGATQAGDGAQEQQQYHRRRFVNDGQTKERVSSQLAGLRRRASIRQELEE